MKNCVTILLKISCLYPIHVNFCQCMYAMEQGNTIFNPPPPYQTPISPPTPPLAVCPLLTPDNLVFEIGRQ